MTKQLRSIYFLHSPLFLSAIYQIVDKVVSVIGKMEEKKKG